MELRWPYLGAAMKSEIKQAWLNALRSGDYQQGRKYLRQCDQYCCLGVLCDLYSKAAGLEWEPLEGNADQVQSMLNHETTLPFKVQEWAGIPGKPNPLELAAYNDNGATFAELANMIEEYL